MGFLNGWFSAVCNSTTRLDGKTAIITGCNTGIGKVTAQDFFERGARVIMACRNQEKAKQAMKEIIDATKSKENLGELVVEELDLMSLKSIRGCCEKLNQQESTIHLLVNNAGVMVCPEGRTEDNFEIQFGTNHLGHFLFTLLLLPKIIKSAPARIVNVSSMAHNMVEKMDFDDINWETKPYSTTRAYGSSKLANILFTKELSKRLKGGEINFDDLNWNTTPYHPFKAYARSKLANVLFSRELHNRLREHNIKDVNTYSLHPGVIKTELGRHMRDTYGTFVKLFSAAWGWFMKTPEQGAQTSIYCAVDQKCANESGLYYMECAVKESPIITRCENDGTSKRLWVESLKMVGLPEDHDISGTENNSNSKTENNKK